MSKLSITRRFLLAVCVGLAGCTVKQTEAPDLAGPSEFSLSFNVTASPDSLTWDGGSQTAVVVNAFNANGGPKAAQPFKLDLLVGGVPADFGQLSSKNVVTGADGRAMTIYTAPPPLPNGSDTPTCFGVAGGCIQVAATPVGTDFFASSTQTVTIRLVPMGTILPPGGTPSASFTMTPTSPAASVPVVFDASASCADAGASVCSSAGLTYAWDFGDGRIGAGRTTSHVYGLARTHNVTLTVTNDRGRQASLTKPITVGAGAAPTAQLVFSPKPVLAGSPVYFDASGSRAAAGHVITGYQWNFGDGTTTAVSTNPLAQYTYTTSKDPGYLVVLTVYDEAGQTATLTETIKVQ